MAKSSGGMVNDAVFAALGLVFLLAVFLVSFYFLTRKPVNSSQSTNRSNLRTAALDENERRRLERRVQQQREREERERRYESAVAAAEFNPYKEKLRKREEERIEREIAEKEENLKRLREETAEFEKWKRDLSVVKEGAAEVQPAKSIQEFVSYVQDRKIVDLSALASAFGIQPEEAVARLDELEKQGKLYGVVDEKARYVCVSNEEVKRITDFCETLETRITLEKLSESVAAILHSPSS